MYHTAFSKGNKLWSIMRNITYTKLLKLIIFTRTIHELNKIILYIDYVIASSVIMFKNMFDPHLKMAGYT